MMGTYYGWQAIFRKKTKLVSNLYYNVEGEIRAPKDIAALTDFKSQWLE